MTRTPTPSKTPPPPSSSKSSNIKQEDEVNPPPKKKKRQKTFTGCFTCRSRKIKCDLKRPSCEKCLKAKLTCAGYDVNLRWSLPIEYVPLKNGDVKSKTIKFPTLDGTIEKDTNGTTTGNVQPEFFHRRLVEFVKWQKPYTTYEGMDQDLAFLQSNNTTNKLNKESDTIFKGAFGVFLGSKRRKIDLAPKTLKRKRTTEQISTPDSMKSNTGVPSSSSSSSETQQSQQSQQQQQQHQQQQQPQDQFWLSNELKDAALVTAAALNTHYLDIMNNFDQNGNVITQTSTTNSTSTPSTSTQNYNSDLFNLVFHNNKNHQNFNIDQIPITNSLNDNENLIDPIYYSNFSNFFYNNPYQLNENLEIQLYTQTTDIDELVDGDHLNDKKLLTFIMKPVQNPINLSFDLTLPSHIGIPLTALQVQPLTRYLLNYYVTEVADLMTVIPLTENPWKAIYFPRALMAIGELSALGKTTNAKNALLNALLAVSAFNLQSKFPKNSEPMKFYLNLGIALRNQASLYIKKLLNIQNNNVQSGIEYCVKNEKYKDVLCAVMSMISVDLVWGTMQDTNLYISWCGKVIVSKMLIKKKLSPKAKILHRIFSSLKLIQDSTCLNFDKINDLSGYDVNGDKFTSQSKNKIDFIINNSSSLNSNRTTSPKFVNKKLINTKKNDENFATDALYGLPNSLIILFSETVELLRSKIYYKHTNTKLNDFDYKAKNLETKLQNWKLDWELFEKDKNQNTDDNIDYEDLNLKFFSSMHQVTYHHIISFYHALVIYFKRFIKDIEPIHLQDKVIKTLNHLNSIQLLIAKGEASFIPLFWQGFIAGCEAISIDLQNGFKKWGNDIAQYLGSYWGARQIMLEVWRRKMNKEPKDDWVNVVKDWEMNLMLN
ncbi:ARG81 [Candida pseudojiufengensis]|uniref:ARG81 n=1 Tax=Candida pseudojiufengensis TaxID=497109 RepID=UPI002224584A|nr:ARG81 [Candida pseudojiufengensis]KAI5961424.1 ARG81 [Candida pseudojiufengensis]